MPNDLDPLLPQPQRLSLADSIADSVAQAIATGHLKPGERIVELALAERLAVSRVPIREAFKILHAQGLVAGGRNRGYRVADFGPETAGKVLETRLMLESFLLRDALAQWRADPAGLSALDDPIRAMEAAAHARDGLASVKADLDFHRAVRDASANEIAATLWDTIARHVLIIFNRPPYRDADLGAVVRHHKAFRDVIRGWAEAPEGPDFATIRTELENHLLQIARRGTDAAPAPRRTARRGAAAAKAAVPAS